MRVTNPTTLATISEFLAQQNVVAIIPWESAGTLYRRIGHTGNRNSLSA